MARMTVNRTLTKAALDKLAAGLVGEEGGLLEIVHCGGTVSKAGATIPLSALAAVVESRPVAFAQALVSAYDELTEAAIKAEAEAED